MRISDWSSDVCSSDLPRILGSSAGAPRLVRRCLPFCLAPTICSPKTSERHNSLHAKGSHGLFCHCDIEKFVKIVNILDPSRSLARSEEHTSELQSLMRISYAVFCLKKKNTTIAYTS